MRVKVSWEGAIALKKVVETDDSLANLLKLGASKRQAVLTGISRKRPLALVKDVSHAYGNDE